ncbi:MAG TPA: tetratricopeptide repeat protein [Rhodanobacteraceae bacterium]|nr:tetratricopeptide repeat protein [Rhodanobacteraceae bacterium]
MRHFVTAPGVLMLAAAGLSGCAGMSARQTPSTPPPAQPLAHLTVATPTADHDVLAQLMDAQFALDHHDLATAAKAYERAAALSDNPEVSQRAAALAIAAHDPAGARQAIERWKTLGATPVQLAQMRAKLALDSGDTAEARRQLEKLVQSGDKDAWRMLGRLLMGARDPAQAGQLLKSIATPARLPSDATAWLAMSELGDKLGQHSYARQIAKTAIERFHCADCYAWAAQLQSRIGQHDKARSLYAEAVKKAPKNTRLRLAYAVMLGKQGDNAAAARVLAAGKQDAATYQARAAFMARAGDMAGLKRLYHELTQAPDNVQAQSRYLLGQLAASIGKTKQALAWFDQVSADDEHRFDADLHTALLWQQLGKTAKAHAIAQQMQTDYADDPESLRKAIELDANLYMSEQQFSHAITSFSRALEQAPDDPGLLYGRGLAYAESGQTDAAVADLRKVLKLKPHDIQAANALGYTLADANRNLDEARKLIERAHEARPHDPAITDSWGWLQYRLGHLDTAEKALQQAWKAAGKDPEIGGHLAEVLWKQGRSSEARKVLAEARKLAPDDAALRALARKISP